MSTAPQSLVGQTIADRYHVISLLGEGGMGRVYLAEHVRMGRKSAVKVLSPDLTFNAEAISRFHREAANASRINHPNVAAIYDFGETSAGLLYLAMEFVEGQTLRAVLAREPRLDLLRAVKVVKQAADALAAAHHLGLVHRDIKPDNIMITRGLDGSELVKVVDFGIAKTVDERTGSQTLTTAGVSVGTPEYMSPEQLAGAKLDARTDVYSLALVFFYMLTGGMPFPRLTSRETFVKRLSAKPRRLDEVAADVDWPVGIQRALDRALAPDVDRRYSSVSDFGREIEEAAQTYLADRGAGRTPQRRVEATTEPTPTRRSRSRLTAMLVVIMAAAALLIRAEPIGRVLTRSATPHAPVVAGDSETLRDSTGTGDSSAVQGDSMHATAVDAKQPDTTRQATIDSAAGRPPNDSAQAKHDTTAAKRDSTAVKHDSTAAKPAIPPAVTTSAASQAATVPTARRSTVPAPVDSAKRDRRPPSPDSASRATATAPVTSDSATSQRRAHRLLRFTGDTAFGLGFMTRGDSTRAEVEDVRGHFELARQFFAGGRPAEGQLELVDAGVELRLLRSRLDVGGMRDLDFSVRRLRQQAYQACVAARDDSSEKDAASRYQCERVFPRALSSAR